MKRLLLATALFLISMAGKAQTQNNITGIIHYDSVGTTYTDTIKVWLITYDSITTTLKAVDSQVNTAGLGGAYYYFAGKPAGNYLLKAAKLGQATGVGGLLPTYHDSSLYWNTAQPIAFMGGNLSGIDIWMRSGTVLSGTGFVGGNVSLGANKGASAGVGGMLIFLRDASNKAIARTYTNANGDFSFSNIPLGTYSVYPEAINYATTPASSLIVSAGSAQITGINFYQDNAQKNIKPHGLIVGGVTGGEKTLHIYPNPASKTVNVSWGATNANGAQIIITNAAGQVVIDEVVSNASASFKDINITQLSPGMYFLHGTASLQGAVQKLIVE